MTRPTVDGISIDHLDYNQVYQDHNGNFYIDFAKIFKDLDTESKSLIKLPPSYLVGSNEYVAEITDKQFDDPNNRVIDLSDYEPNSDNQIVIYLSPEVLKGNTPLTIKGLSKDGDGSNVIINVDTHGPKSYNMNSHIKVIYSDGSERNSQETEYFDDNHLLWNFYDSTSSDKLYTGVIEINGVFQGSLLAPEATINVNKNLDGNIAADKVNVYAETHRWDLQDNNEKETDYEYQTAVPIPGEVPGLPEYPDPGDTDGWELPTPPEEPDNEDGGDSDGNTDEPGDEDGEDSDENTEEPGDEDDEDPDENTEEPGDENGEEPGNETGTDKPVTIPGEVPGVPDYPEVDTDGDGIPDTPEVDTDGDGIPDTPEIDTDGDGIPDTPITLPGVEAPAKEVSTGSTSTNDSSTNATGEGTFPQTSSSNGGILSMLGLVLMSFLGLFGYKRKQN